MMCLLRRYVFDIVTLTLVFYPECLCRYPFPPSIMVFDHYLIRLSMETMGEREEV